MKRRINNNKMRKNKNIQKHGSAIFIFEHEDDLCNSQNDIHDEPYVNIFNSITPLASNPITGGRPPLYRTTFSDNISGRTSVAGSKFVLEPNMYLGYQKHENSFLSTLSAESEASDQGDSLNIPPLKISPLFSARSEKIFDPSEK